ncbi:MAG: hypothetical protein JXQ66_05140 [Campylobacterales bacterium]|nr:hypothetical protein [Campylobacterales bacterium]
MKTLAKITTFIAVFFANHLCAEPSAFGAGDLNNPQPYGLTSSEQAVLENKNKIREIIVDNQNQNYKVESLRERIDGLQSILESVTQSSRENELKMKDLIDDRIDDINRSNEFEKRVSEIIQTNSQNIQTIEITLKELDILVKKIESDYLSKDEFNGFINEFNSFKKLISNSLTSESKPIQEENKRSNWEVFEDAKNSFDKKLYTQSIKDFEYLIEKNFKPAYCNYMIGEMNYRRKNFAEAIAYFKISAGLYQEASYMPELMLHTAISMELTGDKDNAKIFYKAIISKYGDSKEAVTAKTNLEALQ